MRPDFDPTTAIALPVLAGCGRGHYISAHNTCMDYEGIEANYIAGTPCLGADVRMCRGPGEYQGELVAWDVAHNRKAWRVKDEKFPIHGATQQTATGQSAL